MKRIVVVLSLVMSVSGFAQTQLAPVTVSEKNLQADGDVVGFEGLSLKEIPLSSHSYSDQQVAENQVYRLSDLTRLDASISDSYNATGYWDMISVRGYTLDNRTNYRREGLPISAETSIPLENKARIDVLKGLAGIQSGASSPGGVVNYVVKRPTAKNIRDVRSDIIDSGGWLLAADVGGTAEGFDQFGYRFNLAQEKLQPHLKNANGERSLISAAAEWRLPQQSLLEAELEWSKRSQPSQAGFSLLGNKLPDPADPDLNLNNQSWSQPVVFRGLTGTLRYTQNLADTWSWSATAGFQSLGTDDHLAYPYGCSKENIYDRYCSDGTFDFYDFRSDNESRETQTVRLALQGDVHTGSVAHSLNFGLMGWKTRERFERQAYNFVGEGNVEGTAVVPSNGTLNDENTNRDSSNIEASVSDAISRGPWKAWLGLSFNYLERSSVRTDGSRPIDYSQNFPIPWAALSYNFQKLMAYISYGEGLESFVTPNKSGYADPGEFLRDVRSRQYEIGLRGTQEIQWNVALFQIDRPVVTDQSPDYAVDGEDRHRGIELEISGDIQRWSWDASAMLLETRREDSDLNPSLNEKKAINVPDQTLRLGASYRLPWIVGLSLDGRVVYEGERAVVGDNSIMLPSWTRIDAGMKYATKLGTVPTSLKLFVENLADTKYWRESPTQYGHIYLYPGESRVIGLSILANL